jgi:hypothetical protein
MAKKPAFKQISIEGVASYDTREELLKQRQRFPERAYFILKGSVYSLGLAYPPPGIIPAGEAAIATLMVADNGVLFGAATGARVRLFWMTQPFLLGSLGIVEGITDVADGLVADRNGILYGAGREKGDPLFSLDTSGAALKNHAHSHGTIKILQAPFRDDGTAGLAISKDRATIAGVAGRTGHIFLLTLKSGKLRVLSPVLAEGDVFSRVLCAGEDNYFYGSEADGRLFRLSPEGDIEPLPCVIPCRKGKSYLARVTAMVRTRSGRLYGGTEDGYLFSFDPQTRQLIPHGRGNDFPDLHALAEGPGGVIYGIAGRGKWPAHLVSFRPDRAEWNDLGFFQSFGHYPRVGYQVGALVAGHSGQLYAGEKDRFGHLFIYHPPHPSDG